MNKNTNNIDMQIEENWKNESKIYLNEVQKFLDKASNIENEELRKEIIIQMLKCDKELTNIAEKSFVNYYMKGQECQRK